MHAAGVPGNIYVAKILYVFSLVMVLTVQKKIDVFSQRKIFYSNSSSSLFHKKLREIFNLLLFLKCVLRFLHAIKIYKDSLNNLVFF